MTIDNYQSNGDRSSRPLKRPPPKSLRSSDTQPNSSHSSPIDEAQDLVRRCAEPRPVGDKVKAAVRRASQRLDIPFSRVRDIWYGTARRIDAKEIDQLRREAEKADLAKAVAGIKILRNRMLVSCSPASDQVVAGLIAVLDVLDCDDGDIRKGSDEVAELPALDI